MAESKQIPTIGSSADLDGNLEYRRANTIDKLRLLATSYALSKGERKNAKGVSNVVRDIFAKNEICTYGISHNLQMTFNRKT